MKLSEYLTEKSTDQEKSLIKQLDKLGVTDLDKDEIERLLKGDMTKEMIPLKINIGGSALETEGRLSATNVDGKLSLKVHSTMQDLLILKTVGESKNGVESLLTIYGGDLKAMEAFAKRNFLAEQLSNAYNKYIDVSDREEYIREYKMRMPGKEFQAEGAYVTAKRSAEWDDNIMREHALKAYSFRMSVPDTLLMGWKEDLTEFQSADITEERMCELVKKYSRIPIITEAQLMILQNGYPEFATEHKNQVIDLFYRTHYGYIVDSSSNPSNKNGLNPLKMLIAATKIGSFKYILNDKINTLKSLELNYGKDSQSNPTYKSWIENAENEVDKNKMRLAESEKAFKTFMEQFPPKQISFKEIERKLLDQELQRNSVLRLIANTDHTINGVELSLKQIDELKQGKTVEVNNLIDDAGERFTGFVKLNLTKRELKELSENPTKTINLSKTAIVAPKHDYKAQVNLNNHGHRTEENKHSERIIKSGDTLSPDVKNKKGVRL